MEYTAFKLYITIDPTDMNDFLGQWCGNPPLAAVALVLVLVSDRTISFKRYLTTAIQIQSFIHNSKLIRIFQVASASGSTHLWVRATYRQPDV